MPSCHILIIDQDRGSLASSTVCSPDCQDYESSDYAPVSTGCPIIIIEIIIMIIIVIIINTIISITIIIIIIKTMRAATTLQCPQVVTDDLKVDAGYELSDRHVSP